MLAALFRFSTIAGEIGPVVATAGAIDELASSGVLEDFTGREDDIGRQLAQLSASQNVEDELAALKSGPSSGPNRSLPEGR